MTQQQSQARAVEPRRCLSNLVLRRGESPRSRTDALEPRGPERADGGFEEEGPRGRVDEDLEYYWSMHARPVTTKESLRKFLRNYEDSSDQQAWTITHCVEQGPDALRGRGDAVRFIT